MSGGGESVRNDKPSIKYRCSPLEGASTELAQINSDGYSPPSSEINKQNGKIPKENPSGILSTRELVSAIGHVWDTATGPLSSWLDRSSSRSNYEDLRNEEILSYSTGESTSIRGISTNGKTISYRVYTNPDSASTILANLQYFRAIQKKYLLDHSRRHYSDFWRFFSRRSAVSQPSWEGVGLDYVSVSDDLRKVYGWMENFNRPKNFAYSIETKNEGHIKTSACTTEDCNNVIELTSSGNTSIIVSANHHTDTPDNVDLALIHEVHPVIRTLSSSTTLEGRNDTRALQSAGSNTSIQSVRSQTDNELTLSADCASPSGETKCRIRNDDEEICQPIKSTNHHVQSEYSISSREKSYNMTAEKKHAVAGAMAGVSVSLCLHPIDTIKTVVQSCRANQNSLHQIGKSIISERGITGLYRGISSNIASSAPISAIYTFTYEFVKCSLLPRFPKEYQSLAHCISGGCASVATSFIFTPSERIKQQMQICSHYQNCWNALIKIIEKGGFSSLYAGWGAVLCRNVPHSIIKFYTYESLKQLILLPGQLSDSVQTNTFLTLICGGLSGSTAALFTTPFDVVKTRLQTQIPGSKNHYDGVLYTLKRICKNEGMKGLYRGLTPRLFMYMTQGALFFTSYESCKRLFSSDVPALNAQKVKKVPDKQMNEEDITLLPSLEHGSICSC